MRIGRIDRGQGPEIAINDGDRVTVLADGVGGSMRRLLASQVDIAGLRIVASLECSEFRLLAPIDDPGKVVAIGLNYLDHASEVGMSLPTEPLVFAKFPSSIVGPGDPIHWPRNLTMAVDFEGELAVVIGSESNCETKLDSYRTVFGYTCLNDVSARDLQFQDGQWVRGKSLPTFCPIGPWIVTNDELADPSSLALTTDVSGQTMQSARTSDMIFDVSALVSQLAKSLTLQPGDVIATGTPPGIGWTRNPRRMLEGGDTVAVEIEGIGRLENPVLGPVE